MPMTQASVLHTASDGRAELLDLLLSHGAEQLLEEKCGPGEEGRWCGYTALQLAAKRGRHAFARRLIEVGASYDILSAVALGDIARISERLDQDDAELTTTDAYQATALHWAVARDQKRVAELLIERGADVHATDQFGETPLLVAAERQAAHRAISQHGRARGLSVEFPSLVELVTGTSPFDVYAASALGDSQRLDEILREDATMANKENCHGTTPLHWAARNGHLNAARQLLDQGADIDAKDNIGCPPLWYAAYWSQDAPMTQFLCSHGADVQFRNLWGKDLSAYDCGYGVAAIVAGFRE